MGRRLRFVDNESGIVEVSARTLHGRYLLRPSEQVNDLILGVLGRAQAKYPVEIYAFTFLSNHFHLLMRVLSALRMARFMTYLDGNISKELGKLHDWEQRFWGQRYHSASLVDSEEVLKKRFRYILANGCKEGLVASPLDWPGVSSARSLCEGETDLEGTWYDRSAEYRARQRGKVKLFPSREIVTLSPLPFLEGLTAEERRQFAIEAVRQIEQETRERHAKDGTHPLGARKILSRHPHEKPAPLPRSSAPLFMTATREEYLAMRAARAQRVAAYREAADRLKNGEANVRFPEGSFPPPAPFVALTTEMTGAAAAAAAVTRAPPSRPP